MTTIQRYSGERLIDPAYPARLRWRLLRRARPRPILATTTGPSEIGLPPTEINGQKCQNGLRNED